MATPRGAMSAGNYGSMLNGRGNPPRYTHLPHAEAWAKIDEEEAVHKKAVDDYRIEQEVQKRLLAIKEAEVPVVEVPVVEAPIEATVIATVETPVVEAPCEVPCSKFAKGEMAKVLTSIAQLGLGDISQASDSGILITINGVKVCICKG